MGHTNKKENPVLLPHPEAEPAVSVVIPAFNEERYIRTALESLARQTYRNFEVLIVDNNSTDNTAKIALEYGATVLFEERVGVGFARHRGFLEARGAIIASTDADTTVPPQWLERIMEEFNHDSHLVGFGGLYDLDSGPWTARFSITYIMPYLWHLAKFFDHGWSLPGSNFAVRKTAFLRIGGFNEYLRLGEDADLTLRLGRVGTIKFDRAFRVCTSGRRYHYGVLYAFLFTYLPNAIARAIFKKHKFNKLPPIR